MMETSNHLYHHSIHDEKDQLTNIVDKCANVDMAYAFNVPELAPISFDSDLAGYAVIASSCFIEKALRQKPKK